MTPQMPKAVIFYSYLNVSTLKPLPKIEGYLCALEGSTLPLFRLAQLRNHRKIFKRSRIAFDFPMRSQLAQQTAHDLAGTRLGQLLGEANIVWPRERAVMVR